MVLETSADVSVLKGVQDRQGDNHPPANADEQEKTNTRLGNWANGIDDEASDDTAGTWLPAHAIPEGVSVVVQAKRGNTDAVKVGLSSTPTVSLSPGGNIEYRVSDTSNIYLKALSAGDGVAITAEVA